MRFLCSKHIHMQNFLQVFVKEIIFLKLKQFGGFKELICETYKKNEILQTHKVQKFSQLTGYVSGLCRVPLCVLAE